MAESIQHKLLVEKMDKWVFENLLDRDNSFVFIDLAEKSMLGSSKRVFNNVQPDLYAVDLSRNILVIGEAKTELDIGREHSLHQYRSYLRTSEIFDGQSHIVFAVPFLCKPIIKNVLYRELNIRESEKIKVHILEF